MRNILKKSKATTNEGDKSISAFDKAWKLVGPSLMDLVYGTKTTTLNKTSQIQFHMNLNEAVSKLGINKGIHRFFDKINEIVSDRVAEITQGCKNLNEEDMVNFYNEEWEKYKFSAAFLSKACIYLNVHVGSEEQADVKPVYEVCMAAWRDTVFVTCQNNVSKAIFKLIEDERNHITIETRSISRAIDSFVVIGAYETDPMSVYVEHFETAFLTQTGHYYRKESAELLAKISVPEYIRKVEERMNEETRRVNTYLHNYTKPKLLAETVDALVRNNLGIMRAEFGKFFSDDKVDDLRRTYELVKHVKGGLVDFSKIFKDHVQQQGATAIESIGENVANEPLNYVTAIIEVYLKYHALLSTAFASDNIFANDFDEACGKFINKNYATRAPNTSAKSPELIARYCDLLLKKSVVTITEQQLDENLSNIMIVFRYIEDKDVFDNFYTKLFAKRLVHGGSASDDAEASMIAKLKSACGYEYTRKLERMFSDVEISKDMNKNYKKLGTNAGIDIMFQVNVVSIGLWPFKKDTSPLEYPIQIKKCCESFKMFYQSLHRGRALTWAINLCKADVVTNCFKSRYTFSTSTYQLALLLLYNDRLEYTMDELQVATNMEKELLKQVIAIMLKCRILISSKKGRDEVMGDAVISLFEQYKNKKLRVNINVPIKSEQKCESDAVHKTVLEDRKYITQAAIVRIMKARGLLKHQALVQEVIEQLSGRFLPVVGNIKKEIEELIDKEYLTRAREDGKTAYQYQA